MKFYVQKQIAMPKVLVHVLHFSLRWKKMILAQGNVSKNRSEINTNFRCSSVGRCVVQKVQGNLLQELVQAK